MPAKGNQFKSNSFKENDEPRQSIKSEREKSVKPKREAAPPFKWDDGRLVKIIGLLCLVMSIFFLTAFTSYLFTWQEDQSYVSPANGGWHNLFRNNLELAANGVKNP